MLFCRLCCTSSLTALLSSLIPSSAGAVSAAAPHNGADTADTPELPPASDTLFPFSTVSISKRREARFWASGVPSSVSSRRAETAPASTMAARSPCPLWAITISTYVAFSWHAAASHHPRTSIRMAKASAERLTARRPSPEATRLDITARERSVTAMSPIAARREGTRPASTRRGRLTEAMERLKRARRASCLAVGLVSGLRKADSKKGIAPEAPMTGLFESNAPRPRKLATIASEIDGLPPDSIKCSILWTAPAFTIAALFLETHTLSAATWRSGSLESSIPTKGGIAPSIASVSLASGSSFASLLTSVAASSRRSPPALWASSCSRPTTHWISSKASTFRRASASSASSEPESEGSACSSSMSRSARPGLGLRGSGSVTSTPPQAFRRPRWREAPQAIASRILRRRAAGEKVGQRRKPAAASGSMHLAMAGPQSRHL
ncbi:hypothetical protein C4D60_Mb10t25840 [Musa balbisiana]|uniref:Secreted protein n=1 Tax=Musa balbisiana TaxID=52838 RepID=A0A4S8IZR7_MUSBA|nr:hypothetical protein C4D60_Mb10t25840 [Musa balbisiana]